MPAVSIPSKSISKVNRFYLTFIGFILPFLMHRVRADMRSIAEQWGKEVDASNCFFNSVMIGENDDYYIEKSNEIRLMDTSKTSFSHQVYKIVVCIQAGAE